MYHQTIFHVLKDGTKAKFTIRERIIDGEIFYYANVINTELEHYKQLDPILQKEHIGIEITNGRQQKINYRDPERLIKDILAKYGIEWLETER